MQRILLTLTIMALLAGCSTLRFPGVYRIDIPQGNFVTEDMLTELRPGMTPEQVRYVLGPPTLQDPFTEGSWRYLMRYLPGEGEPVEQEIIVYFENDRYSHYEGEVVADLKSKTSGRKDRELQSKAQRRKKQSGTEEVPELDPEPEPIPEGEPRGDEL